MDFRGGNQLSETNQLQIDIKNLVIRASFFLVFFRVEANLIRVCRYPVCESLEFFTHHVQIISDGPSIFDPRSQCLPDFYNVSTEQKVVEKVVKTRSFPLHSSNARKP